ncbi:hypothetical protein [Brevundimonas sp.]|uniref:hypothetical protein n=1 Tax=Brevundimonas sp. TaxID=1871086 RepID=UPI0025B874C0|nr:hypothetical protein [Brevundimonas sp.]
MNSGKMLVIAIDVGGPEKIGWASSNSRSGTGQDLDTALYDMANALNNGTPVALGFEAPIWTPRREDLKRITSRRLGAEITFNRAWSAGAGCGALGAALGLMPWCFSQIARNTNHRLATTSPIAFDERGKGLFVWEAFVSGHAKAVTHMDDASLALAAFQARDLRAPSDVPDEPAINLAAAALMATGWTLDPWEISGAGHVIAVGRSVNLE